MPLFRKQFIICLPVIKSISLAKTYQNKPLKEIIKSRGHFISDMKEYSY